MWLLMPDVSCEKNVAEEYWWEALQSNLMPCHHSRIVLPSVNQNVPKRVRPLVFKPMQHIVCTKGLQDNLLMGNRGWGLRILSSSIWENCWLLFYTHITIFFSSAGTHSKSLHRISHVFLSKSVTAHLVTHDEWLPWCPLICLTKPRQHNNPTNKSGRTQSFTKKSSISFTLLQTSFNRAFLLTSILYKVFQRAIIIRRIHNLNSTL